MITLRKDRQPANGVFRDLMPDLTPLIDVLFILIVFFLLIIAPNFRVLDLQLAADKDAALIDHEPQLVLEITSDYYVLDGERLATLTAVKTALSAAVQSRPHHPLVLATDRRLSMERLLPVLSALQAQGILAASILLRGEEGE